VSRFSLYFLWSLCWQVAVLGIRSNWGCPASDSLVHGHEI